MEAATGDSSEVSERQRQKEARKQARLQNIRSDIAEIVPVRRRDVTDAMMSRELMEENKSRVAARLISEEENEREHTRQQRRHAREGARVTYDPALGDDTELTGAAVRTPRTPSRELSISTSGPGLSSTLGYGPPLASHTLPSVAASYFRNEPAALGHTVLSMASGPSMGSAQPSSTLSSLPPRVPLAFPFGRGAASGPAGVASSAAYQPPHVKVYEESIATGNFRRVDPGLVQQAASQLGAKLGQPLSFSATFLKAKQASGSGMGCCGGGGGGHATVAELDANERESMYDDIGLYVQSGCRVAQGLLAGTLLVIVLQLDRLSNPVTFVQFFGPVLPPLRILMYVLSVMAFLGSAEQAMETRDILGSWFSQYAVIRDAASLRLSTTVRYTWTATAAYLAACATVFASMPSDNKLRMLGDRSDVVLRNDADLPGLVATWKGLIILRFVLVLIGMLASMASASTPTDVYRAMEQAAEVDAEMHAASTAKAVAVATAAGAQASGVSVGTGSVAGGPMSPGSTAGPSGARAGDVGSVVHSTPRDVRHTPGP